MSLKFLIDECTGTAVANFLKNKGFEVFSVFEQWRGASDDEIIHKCFVEKFVLITSDKDFGEMVFRDSKVHDGVILLRCEPNIFSKRIDVLDKLLINHIDKIRNNFIVVSNEKVRIVAF